MMKSLYLSIVFMMCNLVFLHAQLSCRSAISVSISYAGTANLRPGMLLNSTLNPFRRYVLSRSHFNCADVNNSYPVTVFEYAGASLIDSCTSIVYIENKFNTALPCSPVRARCTNRSIPLGSDGELSITPEMVAEGELNPAFNYVVSPSNFDCSNLGVNGVTLTATTTDNVSVSCTTNITITNPSFTLSPCFRLIANFFRFYPANIFINNIQPGTPVQFELELAKSSKIKKQITGKLVMVLSKDQKISKEDKVLFTKTIKMNNKDYSYNVTSKFLIPSDIDLGEYYFIMDVLSTDKKENIGFEKIIKPLTIGNLLNPIDKRTKSDKLSQDDVKIFPNPFVDQFVIQSNKNIVDLLEIYNTFGQMVYRNKINEIYQTIDMGFAPTGIYLIKVYHTDQTYELTKILKLE